MTTWKPWLAAFALAPAALTALAQSHSQDAQIRVVAASCAACHGTNGVSLGGIPAIAGVDQRQLLEKLLAYKKGELPATVMHQHAKGYSDAELAQLADFFSRQKR